MMWQWIIYLQSSILPLTSNRWEVSREWWVLFLLAEKSENVIHLMLTVLQYSIIFLIQLCQRNLLTHLQILEILLCNTTACCYKNFLAIKLVCNFERGQALDSWEVLIRRSCWSVHSPQPSSKKELPWNFLIKLYHKIVALNTSYIRKIY